jgi:hypothetical protein
MLRQIKIVIFCLYYICYDVFYCQVVARAAEGIAMCVSKAKVGLYFTFVLLIHCFHVTIMLCVLGGK